MFKNKLVVGLFLAVIMLLSFSATAALVRSHLETIPNEQNNNIAIAIIATGIIIGSSLYFALKTKNQKNKECLMKDSQKRFIIIGLLIFGLILHIFFCDWGFRGDLSNNLFEIELGSGSAFGLYVDDDLDSSHAISISKMGSLSFGVILPLLFIGTAIFLHLGRDGSKQNSKI